MIGLKRGMVTLVEHSSQWKKSFAQEAKKLQDIFGDDAIEIHHIGSTAIPGIPAKPIIDIALVVSDFRDVKIHKKKLEAIGYIIKRNDARKKERLFFTKGPEENRTHYLHIGEIGSNYIEEMIIFRDYLRTHKEFARKYTALKERLAKEHQYERKTYTAKKSEMVAEIINKAKGSLSMKKHII